MKLSLSEAPKEGGIRNKPFKKQTYKINIAYETTDIKKELQGLEEVEGLN